jgi:hypothetical protein
MTIVGNNMRMSRSSSGTMSLPHLPLSSGPLALHHLPPPPPPPPPFPPRSAAALRHKCFNNPSSALAQPPQSTQRSSATTPTVAPPTATISSRSILFFSTTCVDPAQGVGLLSHTLSGRCRFLHVCALSSQHLCGRISLLSVPTAPFPVSQASVAWCECVGYAIAVLVSKVGFSSFGIFFSRAGLFCSLPLPSRLQLASTLPVRVDDLTPRRANCLPHLFMAW